MAAIIAMDKPNQLRAHLERGLVNGVSKDEVSELLTHLAFYVGWPAAMAAATVAAEFFDGQGKSGS